MKIDAESNRNHGHCQKKKRNPNENLSGQSPFEIRESFQVTKLKSAVSPFVTFKAKTENRSKQNQVTGQMTSVMKKKNHSST